MDVPTLQKSDSKRLKLLTDFLLLKLIYQVTVKAKKEKIIKKKQTLEYNKEEQHCHNSSMLEYKLNHDHKQIE